MMSFSSGVDKRNEICVTETDVEGGKLAVAVETRRLSDEASTPPNIATLSSGKSNFSSSAYSKYFSELPSTGEKRPVKCKAKKTDNSICGKNILLQTKSYANLVRHLETHNISIEVIRSARTKVKGKQPTLEEFQALKEKYPSKSHPKQMKFDQGILNLIAVDGRAFNIVSGCAFKALINDLDPKINIKSRTAYTHKLQKCVVTEVIPSIKATLAGLKHRYCHFSCDIWSTKRREGVLGVLAHYITNEWELRSTVVAFIRLKERHSWEYCKQQFVNCLRAMDVPINWGGVVVTDNASNLKKAFDMNGILAEIVYNSSTDDESINSDFEYENDEEASTPQTEKEAVEVSSSDNDTDNDDEEDEVMSGISDESDDDQLPEVNTDGHLACMSHTLQLAINDALKADELSKELLNYINSVMVFFKKSTVWSDELKKLTSVDVHLPSVTRWNAMLDMVNRFLEVVWDKFFNAIRTVLRRVNNEFRPSRPATVNKKKPPPRSPTALDQKKAQELYQLLRPVGDATDQLQADGPTASTVLISVVGAYRRLLKLDVQYFDIFRRGLLKNLKTRMDPIVNKPEYIISAILDPRQKTKVFKLPWEDVELYQGQDAEVLIRPLLMPSLDQAISILRDIFTIEQIFQVGGPQAQLQPDGGQVIEISNSIWNVLDEAQEPPRAEKSELENYLDQDIICPKLSLLAFWREYGHQFPVLAEIAKKYLAIPASSAGVERVFSIAGAIARSRRAKISIKNVCHILLLRQCREKGLRMRFKSGKSKKCKQRVLPND